MAFKSHVGADQLTGEVELALCLSLVVAPFDDTSADLVGIGSRASMMEKS